VNQLKPLVKICEVTLSQNPEAGEVSFCAKQITYRPGKIKEKLRLGQLGLLYRHWNWKPVEREAMSLAPRLQPGGQGVHLNP